MIKAIFFDLDNTLLWDDKSVAEAFKATCLLAEEKYGVSPKVLEKKVRKHARDLYATYETYPFTQMIGINPFEGLWGDFADKGENFRKLKELAPAYRKEAWTKGLQDVGINDTVFGEVLAERFPIERKKHPYVYPGTFEVLDKLKEKYQLLLITNGSPDLQQTKLRITPELAPYFDHIVVSGAFGKGKPDPAIFAHALGLLSALKDEVIMVGDNLMTDILGASRVGMLSAWVNRHHQEKTEVVPTYEIADLEELLPIIEQANKK